MYLFLRGIKQRWFFVFEEYSLQHLWKHCYFFFAEFFLHLQQKTYILNNHIPLCQFDSAEILGGVNLL